MVHLSLIPRPLDGDNAHARVGKAVPIGIKAAHQFAPAQSTGAALDLRVPPTLLVAADEVIE
jgi:hypothetical protein